MEPRSGIDYAVQVQLTGPDRVCLTQSQRGQLECLSWLGSFAHPDRGFPARGLVVKDS